MANQGPLVDCTVTNFIRGANPIWSLVDLTGKQMDDTFYLYVLQNQIPYNYATVYQDASGTIPWAQPIQFLANGTLPINIYYANNTLYRLEIRQNTPPNPPSQADALIYLVPDYNPSQAVDTTPTTNPGDATTNQITNPQFSVVSFGPQVANGVPATTFTNVTGSFEIAPGWFLDLTGNGSVTVEQDPANNLLTSTTNAPYYLKLIINGPYANAPILRQRFQQNGMNWAGKYVAWSFTGLSNAGQAQVTQTLVDSNGTPIALLGTSTLFPATSQFQGVTANPLPGTTNPNVPPAAWIDYKMILPTSGNIELSSFQLVISDNATNVPYQQDTIDRQLDHTFHYYSVPLQYKAAPSYLIGWDFPFNPAQITGDSVAAAAIGANKSQYAWDQTITFQSVNSGVSVSRDSNTNGLKLTAAQAGSFAVIQYLEKQQARELLMSDMSVYLAALTNNANGYVATVSLWTTDDTNLPNIQTGTNNSLVSAISASGVPTCANGNWTQIPQNGLNNGITFAVTNALKEYGFYGWNFSTNVLANTAKWMAIVIAFAPLVQNDYIVIQSAGLFTGKIPSRPGNKTQEQVEKDCQRYFYSSFPAGATPATSFGVNTGCLEWTLVSASRNPHLPFSYPVTMRATPNVTIYNPAANNNNVRDVSVPVDMTTSAVEANSNAKIISISTDTNIVGTASGDVLQAHITADARLGIVN